MATITCTKSIKLTVWDTVVGAGVTIPMNTTAWGPNNISNGPFPPGDYRLIEDPTPYGSPRAYADYTTPPTGVIATRGGGLGTCPSMPAVIVTGYGTLLGYCSGGVGYSQVDATNECLAGMATLNSLLEFTLPGPGSVHVSVSHPGFPNPICGLLLDNDLLGSGIRVILQTKT